MKNYLYCLVLFFLVTVVKAQTEAQIDSLTLAMCKSLNENKMVKDSTAIIKVFKKHLPGFYAKLNFSSKEESDAVADKIYFRFQRNCTTFGDILSKYEENKSDWKKLSEKPKSKLTSEQSKALFDGGNFYYKEYNGEIVKVVFTKKYWSETFADNTMSKLFFHPKKDNEFQLEFIESDNGMRKNLSKKGDLFTYGVYSFENGVYEVWIQTVDDNSYYSFRLYPADK